MLAGAGLAATSGAAFGAIVHSGPVSIPVPDNIDGVYMNLVTGATGTSGGAVAGWDVNPYSATAGNFNLWAANTTTWLSTGGVIAGPYRLTSGTSIAPAGTYFRPGGGTNVGAEVNLNSSDNLFGVQFVNENGGGTHYGWIRFQFDAGAGTRTIVEYAYEDVAGTAIAAGDVGGAPDISFDSATVNFGNTQAGSPVPNQFLSITNNGTAAGTVTAPVITGPFALAGGGTCPAAPFDLAAATSCTFEIAYTGTAPGAFNGTFSVNAGGADITANLTGSVSVNVPSNSFWSLAAMIGVLGLVGGLVLVRRHG